ncbi:MAG: ABC transporter substrate-binding protein [Nitrospiraceae bacterium]|nr:ABC transporter substrate-binding protein [Nitrospiraceae bacterium]
MKRYLIVALTLLTAAILSFSACSRKEPSPGRVVLQLNWLHDPTFAGHYMWEESAKGQVVIREGGANIAPLAEVMSKRADVAVIGADIFLQRIAESLAGGQEADLTVISVDFQRNPVGWVMHPDAAKAEGLSSVEEMAAQERNQWLFEKAKLGTVSIGDKRGTETTAVWMRWAKGHGADNVKVVPVGFDASVVLSAPKMAYPVYLNEEPFKLGARIGRPVVLFDPAADNVKLYGNVIVCRREMFDKEPDRVRAIARAIAEGWAAAKADPTKAVQRVMTVYTGVDEAVVRRQVEKTLEFVFDGVSEAGSMDLHSGGRWEETVRTLHEAGVLKAEVPLEHLKKHILQ